MQVEAQLAAGYAEGAVALAGGGRPGAARCALTAGYYLEPTVLGEVTPGMSCCVHADDLPHCMLMASLIACR